MDILQKILVLDGHEVRFATEGQTGYSIYLLFKPDVVITDIHMPAKNGMELMKKIRVHNPMVKTIYMSGYLGEWISLLEDEKKRYPVSILQKPFSREDLIRSIAQFSPENKKNFLKEKESNQ